MALIVRFALCTRAGRQRSAEAKKVDEVFADVRSRVRRVARWQSLETENHLCEGLRPGEHREERRDHSETVFDIGSLQNNSPPEHFAAGATRKTSVNDDVRNTFRLPDYGTRSRY